MKTMKAVCTATVLALTLSVSALAGDIAYPGAAHSGDPTTIDPVATATPAPAISTDPTVVVGATSTSEFTDLLVAFVLMF